MALTKARLLKHHFPVHGTASETKNNLKRLYFNACFKGFSSTFKNNLRFFETFETKSGLKGCLGGHLKMGFRS